MTARVSEVRAQLPDAGPLEPRHAGPGLASGIPLEEAGARSRPTAVPLLDATGAAPELLAGRFAWQNINLIAAEAGAGKTSLLLHLVGALAVGASPFDSLPPWRVPLKVLLVSAEDSLPFLRDRLEALVAGHEWDRALVRRHVHALALEPDVVLDSGPGQAILTANIELCAAEVVVFDPLCDLMRGDDSANADAKLVVGFLHQLVRQGLTVFVAHHLSKPSEGRSKAHRIRGASSWYAAARSVHWLERGDSGRSDMTLEPLKLSQAELPGRLELRLAVVTEAEHAARWRSATLTAPGQGGAWNLAEPEEMTPSQARALETLQLCHDEALSFSAWKARADLKDTTLTDARRALLDAGYVRAVPTGRMHAGRPAMAYEITPDGLAALVAQRRNAGATPEQRRPDAAEVNAATPLPPYRGSVVRASDVGTGPTSTPEGGADAGEPVG